MAKARTWAPKQFLGGGGGGGEKIQNRSKPRTDDVLKYLNI